MRPVLTLRTPEPAVLETFYTNNLGMTADWQGSALCLSYDKAGAMIRFEKSDSPAPYQYTRADRYWKIGITLPNVDLAYEQLIANDIFVSEPKQFRDIGYLCHLSDPGGFQIELLQHTFEGQEKTSNGDPARPLGGGAQIGQITIRTTDIGKELAHYQDRLGMTLLSVQPVHDFGFDLYFLAFTNEQPPYPDLRAIENRPWLWQRPYTTIEIQHYLSPVTDILYPAPGTSGFSNIEF